MGREQPLLPVHAKDRQSPEKGPSLKAHQGTELSLSCLLEEVMHIEEYSKIGSTRAGQADE